MKPPPEDAWGRAGGGVSAEPAGAGGRGWGSVRVPFTSILSLQPFLRASSPTSDSYKSRVTELLGSLPAKPLRAAPCPARMHYLVPRSPLPSQAPSTPPLACPRSLSLSLSPTRTCPQPASSPGPQVRATAGFHAPQRPTSFGEEKGRHSAGPLPGRCPRCVRTLESHCLAGR